MKLFLVALTAMRDHPELVDKTEMSVSSVVILFDETTGGSSTPESGAREVGLLVFPIDEGWRDHWEALTELPERQLLRRSPDSIMGPEVYELAWSAQAFEEKVE